MVGHDHDTTGKRINVGRQSRVDKAQQNAVSRIERQTAQTAVDLRGRPIIVENRQANTAVHPGHAIKIRRVNFGDQRAGSSRHATVIEPPVTNRLGTVEQHNTKTVQSKCTYPICVLKQHTTRDGNHTAGREARIIRQARVDE